MFKINDVVSLRFVKMINVNITNTLLFFNKNVGICSESESE